MRLVAALAIAACGGAAAIAAPPPPPVYPKEIPNQLEGYDLRPIYSVYHAWVGRGRGDALEAAIGKEFQWNGKRFWRTILESHVAHYDFGIVRRDRLDLYCAPPPGNRLEAGDCVYRYRFAFVPGALHSDQKREALIRQSFRPEALTKLLRERSWQAPAPGRMWEDKALFAAFERHTNLEALYGPMVELHDVASTECAGLKPALSGLDTITVDLAPDRLRDTADFVPIHGSTTVVRISAMAPTGGQVIVEGMRTISEKLEPLWAAVEACSPPSYAKKGAPVGAP